MKGLDRVTKLQIHISQAPTKNKSSIVHAFLARKVAFKIMISLWLSWHTGGWTAPGRVRQRSLRCHFVGRPLQRRRKLTTDPRGAVVVRMQRHADRCFAFSHRSLSEFSRPSMERSKRRIRNSKESFYKVPGNCYATRLARLDQTLSPQLVYQSWCLFDHLLLPNLDYP